MEVGRADIISLTFLDCGSYSQHYNDGSKIFVWGITRFSTRKQLTRKYLVAGLRFQDLKWCGELPKSQYELTMLPSSQPHSPHT